MVCLKIIPKSLPLEAKTLRSVNVREENLQNSLCVIRGTGAEGLLHRPLSDSLTSPIGEGFLLSVENLVKKILEFVRV
jgi:hypothetical protein